MADAERLWAPFTSVLKEEAIELALTKGGILGRPRQPLFLLQEIRALKYFEFHILFLFFTFLQSKILQIVITVR